MRNAVTENGSTAWQMPAANSLVLQPRQRL